jgi:hypothetical protein
MPHSRVHLRTAKQPRLLGQVGSLLGTRQEAAYLRTALRFYLELLPTFKVSDEPTCLP